jgi:hypothetical protein
MRLSEEEYRALIGGTPPKTKKSKYKNEKAEYKGLKFDSIGERDHYIELELRQRAGEIRDLKTQVSFEIQPAFTDSKGKRIRAITYKADFVYYDLKDKRTHVEDFKGFKTKEYLLKKKLLAFKGIEIEEV